jgi:hypothetical protein
MTSIRQPVPSRADAEALLASLAGVVSAHVVTEVGGRIAEIHILAQAGIHPKQVVRNVESALSAGLGVAIDRRVVSVAQVRTEVPEGDRNGHPVHDDSGGHAGDPDGTEDEAHGSADAAAAGRLEFARYRSHRQDGRCTCEVVLRGATGELVGRGTGVDTAGGRAEAAARAVIDGLQAARPGLRLQLDGAALSSSRGRTFVIVAAHVLLDREPLHLAGAAAITRSPEEAAILASLQATNRWSG